MLFMRKGPGRQKHLGPTEATAALSLCPLYQRQERQLHMEGTLTPLHTLLVDLQVERQQ